ncbi:WD40/YVTN repeat-like containing protein [Gracilaria domingensis]|nr:WD40/YVTN repeat-like containing protein [Gracilaria domingensis]
MEPLTRVVFTFPIYALDTLSGDDIVVAGGGGRMKSGIPNVCEVLSFDEKETTLRPTATVELPDAAVALATHESIIHLVIGPGVKDYNYLRGKLVPVSSFHHDLQVSTSQEQTAISASEDASTLVIASDDGHVVVLRLERFEPIFSGQIHTNGITDLCVNSDGSLVATTGRDKAAHIWRSRDGEILQTLKPIMASSHRTHIRAARFCSTQSDLLFTAESNPRKGGWIAAWRKPSPSETTLYSPIATAKASFDALTAMSVNAEGSLLASSSAEGHVSLFGWNGTTFSKKWSTETRTHLFRTPKPPHVLPVTGMSFSDSGRHVFAASADYTISVWPIRLPTSWGRLSRLVLWLLSALVLIFAILIAEDGHLPEEIRRRRSAVTPYMEPHLSQVQRVVRPLLRESHHVMQPHLAELRERTSVYINRFSEQGHPILEAVSKVYQRLAFENGDGRSSQESLMPESATVGDFVDLSASVQNRKRSCKREREGKKIILHALKTEKLRDSGDESRNVQA